MRHLFYKLLAITLFLFPVVTFLFLGHPQASEKKIIMKCASATTGKDASYYPGHEYMEKRIEQLTDEIDVQIAYGTLGGERQLIEGLQIGTIEGVCTTMSPIGNFVKEAMVFDLPFIFKNWEHLQYVVDGPYGDKVKEKMLGKGIRMLGSWQLGTRDLYYNHKKPIISPNDLKGVKVRVIQSPVFVALYKAYGAVPVPMAWPECYIALKQGAIDGVDSVLTYAYNMKHHEVVDYVTLLHHVYSPGPFLISEKWWKSLSPHLQDIIKQAELEARAVVSEATQKGTLETINTWEKAGVKVIKNPQLDKFREIAFKIYPKFEEEFGKENIEWIRALGEKP